MDTDTVPPQEAPLTVNEQVIVMSGHETIRVLEVGVDASLPVENEVKSLKTTSATTTTGEGGGGSAPVSCPPESSEAGKAGREQKPEKTCGEAGGEVKSLPETTPVPTPGVIPFSQVTSQQTQTLTPVTVQAAPQYCRSSGKSAGAGCVDISCSNGRCPPRTDGCLSYWGNFQITYSQFASCRSAEHDNTSPSAAHPACAGTTNSPATASGPSTDCIPATTSASASASHFAAACHSLCGTCRQAIGSSDSDHRAACRICL
uniref:POU class 6 homeobox 1 n=1 Tax=Salvator merianae TaxID=96440 RepID=A0A8D0BTF7_SALMN